jgi:hypothetical protein
LLLGEESGGRHRERTRPCSAELQYYHGGIHTFLPLRSQDDAGCIHKEGTFRVCQCTFTKSYDISHPSKSATHRFSAFLHCHNQIERFSEMYGSDDSAEERCLRLLGQWDQRTRFALRRCFQDASKESFNQIGSSSINIVAGWCGNSKCSRRYSGIWRRWYSIEDQHICMSRVSSCRRCASQKAK